MTRLFTRSTLLYEPANDGSLLVMRVLKPVELRDRDGLDVDVVPVLDVAFELLRDERRLRWESNHRIRNIPPERLLM